MPEVIVTGAAGFIGNALCKKLIEDGRQVLALSRAEGNICDPSMWANLPPAQTVVHLAGSSYIPNSWKEPANFLAANVVGTQMALDWCSRNGARIVFSSAYVYGTPARLPIHESDPIRPNNPYALSKYIAEQCCEFSAHHLGVSATVLRVFNVFGRGQRQEFLFPTLIKQLSTNEITVKDLAPRRDYIYLPDVVDAFVRALDAPHGLWKFNIGSGKSHSVDEIIMTLQKIAGTNLSVVSENELRPHEIPDVRADVTLAKDILGWKPRYDLAAGIQDILRG